jgi:hypothetical protein
VLPNRVYGLDVTLHVGEYHMSDGIALAQITRNLNDRGLSLDQRHTGRIFRDFVALTTLARHDDDALHDRLRAQGGIVLMCDGVQFEDRSPVLYLAWDAISGQPLFGERKLYRGVEDLVPLLERVRSMDIPVIGIVTDKEKGLVPAVEEVFPGVPYQFCQSHFLKNCASPLKDDTIDLGASVRRRAEAVRKVGKRLSASAPAPEPKCQMDSKVVGTEPELCDSSSPSQGGAPDPQSATATKDTAAMSEEDLAREVIELVRVNSRVSGKSPLDPPELKRHERLENIRTFTNEACKKKPSAKKPTRGRCSTN